MFIDHAGQATEELIGDLAGGADYKPGSDLRQAPADLKIRGIIQDGLSALLFQRHVGGAPPEPDGACLALALKAIAFRGNRIDDAEFTAECRLDRADRGLHGRLVVVVRQLLERLATRNALLQNFRIQQRVPDGLPAY